ncbi:MAG: D-aminoacyl-tRNA deacylase [Opitutales bacterium]
MRAVIQRVAHASVSVDQREIGAIGRGYLIFLGIGREDSSDDIAWLVRRIIGLRIFESEPGRMDQSLLQVDGEALVISQFTLFGSLKKGNRPSFNRAAPPEQAVPLYEAFVREIEDVLGRSVATGRFGANMQIQAEHDGPVTLVVDSRNRAF